MVAGRPALLRDAGPAAAPDGRGGGSRPRAGRTSVAVAWDGRLRGVLVVADAVADERRGRRRGCAPSGCGRCC